MMFELRKKDAWALEVYNLKILDQRSDNVIIKDDSFDNELIYTISEEEILEIKNILSKYVNLEIEDICLNNEECILDGCSYEFIFNHKVFVIENFDYYIDDSNVSSGVASLIQLLNEISDILKKNDINIVL